METTTERESHDDVALRVSYSGSDGAYIMSRQDLYDNWGLTGVEKYQVERLSVGESDTLRTGRRLPLNVKRIPAGPRYGV